jgi:hypothetical protein
MRSLSRKGWSYWPMWLHNTSLVQRANTQQAGGVTWCHSYRATYAALHCLHHPVLQAGISTFLKGQNKIIRIIVNTVQTEQPASMVAISGRQEMPLGPSHSLLCLHLPGSVPRSPLLPLRKTGSAEAAVRTTPRQPIPPTPPL